MKIASIIFMVIGLIVNFYTSPTWLALIGLGFGITALVSLGKNVKHTWIGVCALIFTSLTGGVLYLCWRPDTENK